MYKFKISHPEAILIFSVCMLCFISVVDAISCYNCSSVNHDHCPAEMSSQDEDVVPLVSCDSVYEAQYCVKTNGVTGGSLGITRFCSSRDMGNYCEYIRRPGDQLEYRSCVFTCTSDGCNNSGIITASISLILVAIAFHFS